MMSVIAPPPAAGEGGLVGEGQYGRKKPNSVSNIFGANLKMSAVRAGEDMKD